MQCCWLLEKRGATLGNTNRQVRLRAAPPNVCLFPQRYSGYLYFFANVRIPTHGNARPPTMVTFGEFARHIRCAVSLLRTERCRPNNDSHSAKLRNPPLHPETTFSLTHAIPHPYICLALQGCHGAASVFGFQFRAAFLMVMPK